MNNPTETDGQLVAAIAGHDPMLAQRVQLRLRSLRLRLVVGLARPEPEQTRPTMWQSLRWPWRQRG